MPRRILFVHSRKASFVATDRELLAERYEIRDWYQPGRLPSLPPLIPALVRSDAVFAWFASWHSFFPITLAWLLRKPSVLIVGGFDTANMPDIGYGYQQGGLRRFASRWIMRRAGRLVTNSRYSRREIERNTPIPANRVTVVHHGVPDPFGALPEGTREPEALTVGHLVRTTLEQKGHRPFVEAARQLPDVRFVLVGAWHDDAIELLRGLAPENVEFTGWLSDEELRERYRRAAVYVQASRHEGFGLAVAEAMLAGCVPVVADVTAMPEVVGDAGIRISSQRPEEVAEWVREALALGPEAARRARERIVSEFPLERRRQALLRVVEEELGEAGVEGERQQPMAIVTPSRGWIRLRGCSPIRPMRDQLKRLRQRPADIAVPADAARGAAGASSPSPRRPGKMRRRLHQQQRLREALLLDLGAIVFELHRQGRRAPELLQAKAAELGSVDREVRALTEALGAHESVFDLVAPGIAGSCSTCGAIVATEARYCSNCGVPTDAALGAEDEPSEELTPELDWAKEAAARGDLDEAGPGEGLSTEERAALGAGAPDDGPQAPEDEPQAPDDGPQAPEDEPQAPDDDPQTYATDHGGLGEGEAEPSRGPRRALRWLAGRKSR